MSSAATLPLVGLLLAYVMGSVPTAYIAGKATRGIDLREHGSGNLGATNVYRVLGWRIALVVFLVDLAKGAVPVFYFPTWFHLLPPRATYWAIAYGVAAIAGHVRPVFLLWRGGGKGIATAAGVFLALAPLATLVAFLVWLAVLYRWGYVSLGSLCAAVTLPLVVALRQGVGTPLFVLAAVLAAFVFWTHRANIGRLRRGEEHRFGRKKPA